MHVCTTNQVALNSSSYQLLHIPPPSPHILSPFQHDPETNECAPGGGDGNFIMYAFASSGNAANNDEFSPCSRRMMDDVIEARGQNAGVYFEKHFLVVVTFQPTIYYTCVHV